MGIPTVSIELPFGFNDPRLNCPACGASVFEAREGRAPCPHTLFSFFSEIGNFGFMAPQVKAIVDGLNELPEEERDIFNPVQELVANLNGKSAFCMEVTFGGMACGPVWTTAWVGFDFDPPEVTASANDAGDVK